MMSPVSKYDFTLKSIALRAKNTISKWELSLCDVQLPLKMHYVKHPRLESILSLDFNKHGKTLYYSIFYPFCYTGGGSHLLYIEGFQYRGKMDIIDTKYVGIWTGSEDLYKKIIVFIRHFYSSISNM